MVTARIGSFLKDSGRLIDELGPSLAPYDQNRLIVAAIKQAERWPQIDSSEQRSFVLRIVASITLGEKDVQIILHCNELRHTLLGDETSIDKTPDPGFPAGAPDNGDEHTLRVPAQLKLCSGAMRLVIPPGRGQELRPRPNLRLIKALSRAYRWKEKLFSGEAPSISAIAKSESVTDRYVSRIMRLAFLAPDIVEAILDGYQPADLELERLMKGVPISWTDQRRDLGFSRS